MASASDPIRRLRDVVADDAAAANLLRWIRGAHIAMSEEGIGADTDGVFPEDVVRTAFDVDGDASPCGLWNYGLIDRAEHAARCDCSYARADKAKAEAGA